MAVSFSTPGFTAEGAENAEVAQRKHHLVSYFICAVARSIAAAI